MPLPPFDVFEEDEEEAAEAEAARADADAEKPWCSAVMAASW
jgi:hypothetical protein